MNRNWDIMRNAANGADPYGTTRRFDQNRMRDRERWTSRDREEGFGDSHGYMGRQYVGSYGDEGFGRPSQGWGSQGYGGGRGSDYGFQGRGSSRYGGYGYEHGESEAYGDGGGYGYDRHEDRGLLGRMEQGIDRAFGNEWDGRERGRGMRHDEPSLWERVKGAFTGKGPKNWTRSDERIREDVCECLTYHPHIDASEIDVTVKDGEVTLSGTVHDRQTKRLAEDVVEDVRGVHDVHNQLRVMRAGQGMTSAAGASTTTGSSMPTNQAWNQTRR